eukprot:Unigene9315_Nuclearia_a/m.28439 Unigene9315_Nuclearia_a/g.28439  ORF Unigene9315_Nuclearia_a/g.28439 Unigene9315_Nuclearia_a/m.28439 type:complete len:224 (+) Unigene9315_Nuclearia_a:31-702(+)
MGERRSSSSQRVLGAVEAELASPSPPLLVPPPPAMLPASDRFSLDEAGPPAAAASPAASPASDLLRARIPVLQQANRAAAVFTSGRPPWYSKDGQVKEAFMIACAGGSASGKTSVAEKIIELLDVPWVVLLSMDSFYKALTPEQIAQAHRNEYNFDCPEAFDYDLLRETIKLLKAGKQVEIPTYDFSTHSRWASCAPRRPGAPTVIAQNVRGQDALRRGRGRV